MKEMCPVCNNEVQANAAACPICGFKFLGSTQSFEPLKINGEEVIKTARKTPTTAVLRVLRGPQIDMVYPLKKDSYTIGRDPKCDIFLNDMTVSRTHATITRSDAGYRIEDANSFNGVWINNKNIDSSTLQNDDIIQIGVFCLLYEEDASA